MATPKKPTRVSKGNPANTSPPFSDTLYRPVPDDWHTGSTERFVGLLEYRITALTANHLLYVRSMYLPVVEHSCIITTLTERGIQKGFADIMKIFDKMDVSKLLKPDTPTKDEMIADIEKSATDVPNEVAMPEPAKRTEKLSVTLTIGDITDKLVREAEARAAVLQTQAAINIGIGVVLAALGETEIKITSESLQRFNSIYRVEQDDQPDGGFKLTLVKR